MKLPGDSDKQDKGVSHEMMQRSLQSQRRVVKRVGVLEDRVEAIDLKLATPTETPLALPPSPRQLALPPSKEEPPEPTPVESDEDWEGDPMDHRDLPWAKRGIDEIRDQIDKDPNIPFGDDKIPYEDDITQIMKDRDESIEKDKEEDVEDEIEKERAIQPEVLLDGDSRGEDAKPLPTADGKSQRRKTKGKGKIGLPKLLPAAGGVAGGAMIGGLKQIAKNINEARQALFDFYKIQKDRFKLRKKLDKSMQTKIDAQKDEASLEGDPKGGDEDAKKDPKTGVPEKKQSDIEKTLMSAFWGSIATMFFPLLIKGLGTFFNDQADEIENTEPEDPGTEEEEKLANDLEDDTNKLNQEEKQAKQGEEGEERTEVQNEEQTQVTDVQSAETQDTNLESNTSMMQSNVSNQEQSEQEEVQSFAEGGKITTTSATTNKPKPRGGADGVKPPKLDTNKRQGLQQLRKSDLSGKGAKALSKFVAPIKSVFKLPNIVAKNTLKLGKKILSPVGKLAGAAISKHPLAMMGKGIMNMVKGDKGDKGDGGDSKRLVGDDSYYHPDDGVIRGYRSFKNFSYTNNYSNAKFDETLEGEPQTPVVEQSKTNKLTEIASSFGSNIMSDIKERGVTGVMGGIADAFTGNLFDFDGKNLKPDEMKNAQIDKGESVTSKMIAALDGARSVQRQQVVSKENSGTGPKMKIPARPTSKSSPSSINKSLQPGL
tara:strand:- start:851 stop:2983 length:2133 start_codon:yes stop_codon:yes gene_type:complete